jgi:cytochrome c-type biogenesis protein CcsB
MQEKGANAHGPEIQVKVTKPASKIEAGPIEPFNVAMGIAATAAAMAAAPADASTVDATTASLASATPVLITVQQACAKASFSSLFASTGIYWGRAAGFGGGVEGKEHGKFGMLAMLIASASLFVLLSARWIESGHFPISNMYESLLFMGWGVTAVHFWIANTQPKSAFVGALTSPLALLATTGATLLLPKEFQSATALVPALQSNWLMMHVSVMMMGYATLMAGSLTAGAALVVSAPSDGVVGKARDTVTGAFAGLRGESAQPSKPDEADVAVTSAAATTLDADADAKQPSTSVSDPWAEVASSSGGNVATVSSQASGSLLDTTSDLAYQCCFLGWMLLTVGLISGAVWANEAWGAPWSWDPKETWALITWFIYTAYLHMRITPKYTDRSANAMCFAGFIVTWVCYLGVNLFGLGNGGLHSYGNIYT